MSTQKEIYELVKLKGDGLYRKIHIIINKNNFFSETHFKVYHSDGICFDVYKREPNEDDDERDIEEGFIYTVISDFDGFAKIDDENILRVLTRTFNYKP